MYEYQVPAYAILNSMNTEQILLESPEATDISTQLPDITSSINDALGPLMWLSVALTIVFLSFYITAMFRRRKLENALFDIQKNISEMNERDKARSRPAASTVQPQRNNETDRIIAQKSE